MATARKSTTARRTTKARLGKDSGWIRSAAQARALVSPARQEIIDALDAAGPCSVSALAALIGRAPDGLYFHLRRLESCGLVKQCERTREGRHTWATYDVAERPVRLDYDSLPTDSVAAVIAAAMRLGTRDFKRAMRKGGVTVRGNDRDLWGARIKGWITPANIRRINELLNELRGLMHNRGPAKGTKAMSISFVMAPAGLPDRVANAVNNSNRPAAPSARRLRK
ncbi:MAG: helix-turn-helix domain-containing protein [Phycisphaerales bacterium]